MTPESRRVRFATPTLVTGLTIGEAHYAADPPTMCTAMRWYRLELDHERQTLVIHEEEPSE